MDMLPDRSDLLATTREKMSAANVMATDLIYKLKQPDGQDEQRLSSLLRVAINIFSELGDGTLSKLPNSAVREIGRHAQSLIEASTRVSSYRLQPGKYIQGRPDLVEDLEDVIHSLIVGISPFILTMSPGAWFASSVEQSVEIKVREKVRELEKQLEETKAVYDSRLAEVVRLHEALRPLAIDAPISRNADVFGKEARNLGIWSIAWLICTGGLVFLLCIILWNSMSYYAAMITPGQFDFSVPYTITKIAVASFLITMAIWTGRVYRSLRHNRMVYKHRELALKTFHAFTAASDVDKDVRSALLLQACQCVFSHQPTGFSSNEADLTPHTQILEIVKSAGSKKSS